MQRCVLNFAGVVMCQIAAVVQKLRMTVPGTKRTFQTVSFMSAFGGKAAGNWSPCFRLLLTQSGSLSPQTAILIKQYPDPPRSACTLPVAGKDEGDEAGCNIAEAAHGGMRACRL